MFDSLTDKALRAAHLLYGNHRALGLDPDAIKADTLRGHHRGSRKPAHVGQAGRRRHASRGMIAVEDDEQSGYHVARTTLTARYGHLGLTFTPASVSASRQHEASWAGGAASAGTEDELLALVRAALGDCGGEGHLWVTVDFNRDPACSDNVLISQRLECVDCPAQERVITLYHPQPTPAEATE
jgi:hypothetical protein